MGVHGDHGRGPEGVLHETNSAWLLWLAMPVLTLSLQCPWGLHASYSVMLTTDITSLTHFALILCLHNTLLMVIWLHMESPTV